MIVSTGCSPGDDSPADKGTKQMQAFASTYTAMPSTPVLITGATILTGTGERIDGGSLLLAEGRNSAVGTDLTAPEGHRRSMQPGSG